MFFKEVILMYLDNYYPRTMYNSFIFIQTILLESTNCDQEASKNNYVKSLSNYQKVIPNVIGQLKKAALKNMFA